MNLQIKNLRQLFVRIRNYAVFKKNDIAAYLRTEPFTKDHNADFVISISSYPARISLVPAVFESLGRQVAFPKSYFLVLTEEEWPERKVPNYIDKLVSLGVEIVWVKGNSFAVKNIAPIVEQFPDVGVVILDDDIIYGKYVISDLVNSDYVKSGAIVGHVAKSIHRVGDNLSMWHRHEKTADPSTPTTSVFFIGYSGIYYPRNTLDKKVSDLTAIKKIVPGRGKDIWLYAAAIAANSKQVCLGSDNRKGYYIPIPVTNTTKPREWLSKDDLDQRFQKAIDYFGIREKLLRELPDASEINDSANQ